MVKISASVYSLHSPLRLKTCDFQKSSKMTEMSYNQSLFLPNLHSIIKKLLTLFLTIILFITLLPLLLIATFPFILIRQILSRMAKYIRSDLGKMVTARGTNFAIDDLYKSPKCNVLVALTLQGNLDLDKAVERTRKAILEARFPNGELKYPELKQYLTSWFGFYFWKDDQGFDHKNHIQVMRNQSEFTDADVQRIRQETVESGWTKGKPLWKVIFMPNCYLKDAGPYTTMLVNFHHSLGDGYSWLNVFEDVCEQPLHLPTPNYLKRDPCFKFLFWTAFPFRGAYDAAEILRDSFLNYPFKVTSDMKTGRFYTDCSDKISVSKVKEIKSHFEVSFSSVLFAALAGALREYLVIKGMDVPTTFPAFTMVPLSEHSLKLRNFMTAVVVQLPTGEPDPIARLKFSFKDYRNSLRSTTSILMQHGLVLTGSHFSWIVKLFGRNHFVPSGISNFPAGLECISVYGHPCVDIMFTGGVQLGCEGLGFAIMSYADGLRISTIGDAAVMSQEDVKCLTDLIQYHLNSLRQLGIIEILTPNGKSHADKTVTEKIQLHCPEELSPIKIKLP